MATVGSHCNCRQIQAAESATRSKYATYVNGLLLLPPFISHQRFGNGTRSSPFKKRILLRGLKVECTSTGTKRNFGRGTAKLKNEAGGDETGPVIENGAKKFQKLPGTLKLEGIGQARSKDSKLVFVAGATGRVGSRTVRELLKLGFRVRAGTRDVEKAQGLLEDVLQENPEDERSMTSILLSKFLPGKFFAFLTPPQEKKVEIVQCDLENPETIEPALENASVVVCCIGASEKDALNVTGPYRIDYKATENLINAATNAQVNQFVLLTSLGTRKIGFPASLLNLFWGVLLWKGKAEQALIDSSLPYTIVRPGGMERPTDSYKETHNLVLAEADTLFGGQVSNLQVAELIASIVANPKLSENKVLEVIAETTAPFRSIEELLAEIPDNENKETKSPIASIQKDQSSLIESGQRQTKRLQDDKVTEKERLEAERVEQEKRKKEALRIKYENEIIAAREKEAAARKVAEAALKEKTELERKAAELRAQAEAASLAFRQAKAIESAVLAAAKKGQLLTDQDKKEIMEAIKSDTTLKAQGKPNATLERKPPFSLSGGLTPLSQTIKVPPAEISNVDVPAETKVKEEQLKAEAEEGASRKLQAAKDKSETEGRSLRDQDKEAINRLAKEDWEQKEKKTFSSDDGQLTEKEPTKERAFAVQTDNQPAANNAFRWFWQLSRPDVARIKDEFPQPPTGETVQDNLNSFPERFPDLKHPSSPTPCPPISETVTTKEDLQVEAMDQTETKAELGIKRESKRERTGTVTSEEEEMGKLKTDHVSLQKSATEVTSRKEGALVKEKSATVFFWPWQKPKPASVSIEPQVEPPAEASPASLPANPSEQVLPRSPTPLSPYIMFPDLKPPSTPSPNSPNAQLIAGILNNTVLTVKSGNMLENEETLIQSGADQEAMKLFAEEVASREREALEKAKTATAFFWPWQKPKPSTVPAEPQAEPFVDPHIDTTPVSFPGVPSEQYLPQSQTPLSPYIMFPELKPPSSPTPLPPRFKESQLKPDIQENEVITMQEKTDLHLQHVSKVQNLESVVEDKENLELKWDQEASKKLAAEVASREREALERAKAATAFSWPWKKPTPANVSAKLQVEPLSESSLVSSPSINPVEQDSKISPQSPRPLSPYSMYDDLKPPTSPTPKLVAPFMGEDDIDVQVKYNSNRPVKVEVAEYKASRESNEKAEDASNKEDIRTFAEQSAEDTATVETAASEKAKAATGFHLPWQNLGREVDQTPRINAALKTVELPTLGVSSDLVSKELPPPNTSLSPYTRYPDLRPPCSPTPFPPRSISMQLERNVETPILDNTGGNGAVVGDPEVAKVKVSEPTASSGF